jgi:hypothetical protein
MLDCWRMILRILNGGARPRVAGTSPGRIQVDAGQEGGEFGGGHLEAVGPGGRQAEGPAFEPLELGITVPSLLWRYTKVARSGRCRHESSASLANRRDGSWE